MSCGSSNSVEITEVPKIKKPFEQKTEKTEQIQTNNQKSQLPEEVAEKDQKRMVI